MAQQNCSIKFIASIAVLAATCAPLSSAMAASCLATQTSITLATGNASGNAPTPDASAAPAIDASAAPLSTAINTQDINLEKSFMQDGDSERAQYSTRDGDPMGKELFISASVDTATGDTTLIIRDLRTGLSANAAGAFGNDGVIATSLSGVVNGIQKLITVTCQK